METMFWKRFTALCAEERLTPNGVMLRCGLNTGNPTAWKNGRIPGAATLEVLSGFFACPIEYLLGKTDARTWDEINAEEKENSPSGELDKNAIKFALFGTDEIDDAKLNEVLRYAAYVRDL
jgi:hypothetical protein